MFDNKYIKTKLKSYNLKITTNFHRKEIKEGSKCICLLEIAIDSVFKIRLHFTLWRQSLMSSSPSRNKTLVTAVKNHAETDITVTQI